VVLNGMRVGTSIFRRKDIDMPPGQLPPGVDNMKNVSVKIDPELRAFLMQESERLQCTFSSAMRYHLRLAYKYRDAIRKEERKHSTVEFERGR
jgi:hypothetical protein